MVFEPAISVTEAQIATHSQTSDLDHTVDTTDDKFRPRPHPSTNLFWFPMKVEPFAHHRVQVRVPQLNAPLIIPLIYVDTTPYPKKLQALDNLSWRFYR